MMKDKLNGSSNAANDAILNNNNNTTTADGYISSTAPLTQIGHQVDVCLTSGTVLCSSNGTSLVATTTCTNPDPSSETWPKNSLYDSLIKDDQVWGGTETVLDELGLPVIGNEEEIISSTMAPPHNDDGVYRRILQNESQLRGEDLTALPPPLISPDDTELDEEGQLDGDTDIPTRWAVIKDPANLCTFSGALLAMLAMASMWRGRYYLGMFFNVAANIADIIDGPIARSTPRRHPSFSLVGSKLDCYSDLVSHFVVPASLLMHAGDLNPVYVGLAAVYVCAGIMRQSYFEVTGRCDGGRCVFGVTSDYMVGIYCLTMHFRPFVTSHSIMLFVLSASIAFMIFCSLTFSLRSRRYDGLGLIAVTTYNVLLCCSCALMTLFSDDAQRVVYMTLPALLVLAYPCYFRYVEING